MSPADSNRRTVVYAGLPGVLNLHHPGFVEFFDSSPPSDASLRLDGRSCPSRSFDIAAGLADAPCAWPPAGTHHCSTSAPSNTTCRYRTACRTTGTGSLGAGQGHEEGRSASLPALQKAGRRAKKKLPFMSFRLVAELVRSPKGSVFGLLFCPRSQHAGILSDLSTERSLSRYHPVPHRLDLEHSSRRDSTTKRQGELPKQERGNLSER